VANAIGKITFLSTQQLVYNFVKARLKLILIFIIAIRQVGKPGTDRDNYFYIRQLSRNMA